MALASTGSSGSYSSKSSKKKKSSQGPLENILDALTLNAAPISDSLRAVGNLFRPNSFDPNGAGNRLLTGGGGGGSAEPNRAQHLADLFSGDMGSTDYDPTLGGLIPGAQKMEIPNEPAVAAPEAQQDPTLAALNQLAQLAMGAGAGMDPQAAAASLAQMTGAIRKSYGGQIGAIRGANKAARRDTKAGRAEVEGMYNALGNEYRKQAAQNQKQSANLSQQLEGLGSAQQRATQAAADSMNAANRAQAQAMGSTGIDAQMNADVASTVGRQADAAGRAGTNMASDALQMGGNTTRYLGTQGMNSRLEGTNRSADMLTALQDYLNQNRSKIAEVAGARDAAIAKAQMDMQNQQAEAAASSQGDMFRQLAQVLGMKMDYADQQHDNMLQDQKAMGGGGLKFDNPALAAMQQATQANPALSPIISDFLDNASMTDPNFMWQSKDVPLNSNMGTLQSYINAHEAKKGYNLDPQSQQLLLQALWAYVNQGKGNPSNLPGGLG